MSVVIIGGHDRMVCQYKQICKQFKCKAKVFTQMSAAMSKQIGSPDLIVLFTNTVSHKMVRCAVEEAGRCNAEVVRCHTSSKNALEEILGNICAGVSFLDVRGDISERKAEAVKKTRLWQYNGTGGKEFFKQILCRLYRCK